MIQATARVLKNVIEVQVGDETWVARPVESGQAGFARRIVALFSTEYVTYRPNGPTEAHSTISYHPKSDEIRIQIGEEHWRTQSTTVGPMTIDYGGVHFTINERLTGRFAILRGSEPVGLGQLGFRSCVIRDYPPDLEIFFANLALGYVIRTLTWEIFGWGGR
ncbi:MAG TPA: hypothetical protein VEK13_07530 [Thermoplasmata archaeon]|nr:hypothetical protein [Thermoplasmata archaeon]